MEPERVQKILTALMANLPSETSCDDLTEGSGIGFVDIRVGDRFFAIEFSGNDIGISELTGGAEDWDPGHDRVIEGGDEAKLLAYFTATLVR